MLAERDLVTADADGGYVLSIDPMTVARLDDADEKDGDPEVYSAILRDRCGRPHRRGPDGGRAAETL